MKGKSITFRPKKAMRERLDKLAESSERPITFFIDKAIEAHLPELEKKYGVESGKDPETGQEPTRVEEGTNASTTGENQKTATEFVRKHVLPDLEKHGRRKSQK